MPCPNLDDRVATRVIIVFLAPAAEQSGHQDLRCTPRAQLWILLSLVPRTCECKHATPQLALFMLFVRVMPFAILRAGVLRDGSRSQVLRNRAVPWLLSELLGRLDRLGAKGAPLQHAYLVPLV